MKLSQVGLIALSVMTVSSLAVTATPTVASAKAYKISKSVLRHKNKLLAKTKGMHQSTGVLLFTQTSKKNLKIAEGSGPSINVINYKIKHQKVKGSKMTFTVTPNLSKRDKKYGLAKGKGILTIQRTGKSTYKIPKIYVGNGFHRLNANKFFLYNEWIKPKKVSEKGFKLMTKKHLRKVGSAQMMMRDYFN